MTRFHGKIKLGRRQKIQTNVFIAKLTFKIMPQRTLDYKIYDSFIFKTKSYIK